jgi:hypothetical protein
MEETTDAFCSDGTLEAAGTSNTINFYSINALTEESYLDDANKARNVIYVHIDPNAYTMSTLIGLHKIRM